jgi:hypothetical protein
MTTLSKDLPATRDRTAGIRATVVAGLLLAAVGIVVQRFAGVEMPAVPPGVVILVVPAVLITVLRWRWLPILAILAAGAELAGLIMVGGLTELFAADNAGVIAGAWMRLLGSVAGLVFGVVMLIMVFRKPGR